MTNTNLMIRLPTDDTFKVINDTTRRIEVKENVNLEKLARAIIEQKIRPEILREDVITDLVEWLRDTLSKGLQYR